jgi:hypothetical protein
MNYGPLEFAKYLTRTEGSEDSAAIKAARAAAPIARSQTNRLSVISGRTPIAHIARASQVDLVSVHEAVAMRVPSGPRAREPVNVLIRSTSRPVVLVLSAHQAVHWAISIADGAVLTAVLLSGYGESTVSGAGGALVTSIGGFYAFKRGSPEFKHLESEVLRCTGRHIDTFQSVYAGKSFEI